MRSVIVLWGVFFLKDYADSLSSSFCNCGRGWIKELFEPALKRPVDVKPENQLYKETLSANLKSVYKSMRARYCMFAKI
jgi:hypothetical protein